MTRAQALALGSPTVIVLVGCLAWAVVDRMLRPLGKPVR